MATYEVGQQWSFHCRQEMTGSMLVIARMDERADGSTILHVEICVRQAGREKLMVIGHMPFSTAAMDASVVELLASDEVVHEGFQGGYDTWKKNNGGVFDLPVAEAIDSVMQAMRPEDNDPFDRMVRALREQKPGAKIEGLFHMLFQLEKWYFLCDPENERIPVQWVFPDGQNTDPALLGFTTRARAASAAVSLGIYEEGASITVMPVPLREAVAWVSSADCGNTWICFNLTFENFPLYCDDAPRLLKVSSRVSSGT